MRLIVASIALLFHLSRGLIQEIQVKESDLIPANKTTRCLENEVPYPGDVCAKFDDAFDTAYKFLEEHLPSWDLSNAETLGFHSKDDPSVDGLELGVATLGINISLETKQLRPWAADVPEDVYNEYVVTYAHVNEARSNWRAFLTPIMDIILQVPPS